MTEAEFIRNLTGADQLRRTARPDEAAYWTAGSYLAPGRSVAGRLAGGEAGQRRFASLRLETRGKAVLAADRPESRSGRKAPRLLQASAASLSGRGRRRNRRWGHGAQSSQRAVWWSQP